MIVTVDEVLSLPEFINADRDQVKKKLDALETMVRKYTNNNFQNRNIRFSASSEGQILKGCHPFIRVGDTLQISDSEVNDGLYVVAEVDLEAGTVTVDNELFPVPYNLVTKIVYPADVKDGVINLMKWENAMRDKVGIQSETLSRHSVTYFNQDANNQVMGYPASLMGFLKAYIKARF